MASITASDFALSRGFFAREGFWGMRGIPARCSLNHRRNERKTMNDEVKKAAQQLATDLDKMPGGGEQIIESLLTGIVLLKREVATLKEQHAAMVKQVALLIQLTDRNEAAIAQMSRPDPTRIVH